MELAILPAFLAVSSAAKEAVKTWRSGLQ